MKCSILKRLARGFVAVLAVAAVPAVANDRVNPAGASYYGYGASSFGYGGVDAAPGMPTYGAPGYAGPGTSGAAPQFTTYAGYGGYPYGYSGYGPNYGFAGYGYGYASGGYGGAGYGRRPHHCSFGSNCPCCNNVWDGYGGGDCGYGGGCCAGPTKVHRRHRPLGCGAGPCVDASCGAYGSYGRPHRCHRRYQQSYGCGPTGCNGGYAPAGMTFEPAPAQNAQPLPATEQVQPPMPGIDSEGPPTPEPSDSSST